MSLLITFTNFITIFFFSNRGESGNERRWGHDKYEEMNTMEQHYDTPSFYSFDIYDILLS